MTDRKSEYAKYISFWSWEYTRRNNIYIDVHRQIVNGTLSYRLVDSVTTGCKVAFLNYYILYEYSAGNQYYRTSKDILDALSSGTFCYRFPLEEGRIEVPIVSYKEAVLNRYIAPDDSVLEVVSFAEQACEASEANRLYLIDLNQPEEALVLALRHIKRAYDSSCLEMDECDRKMVEEENRILYRDQYEDFFNYNINKKQHKQFDNVSRAIGLWLWDRVHEEKISQAEAIRLLLEQYDLEFLGKGDTEDTEFRRYYRRTKACIERLKMVSFSKKAP